MTHPIVPVKVYIAVWAALIILTITTVAVSKIELGEFNFIAAMSIAVLKGALVVLFFMHVKQSTALVQLMAGASLFWLAIMLVFLLSDYYSRNWLPVGEWW